jgi:hypothetical protein
MNTDSLNIEHPMKGREPANPTLLTASNFELPRKRMASRQD